MKRQVLFIHGGGGQEAYEEDEKLAADLRDVLGDAYAVRYPKMPVNHEYEAWREQIARELAALGWDVVLVGHSLGASILLKYLSEEELEKPVAGIFLIAPPYWGLTIGKSASTRCKTALRRSSLASCRCSSTIAAMTRWCRLHTSSCIQRGSIRQPLARSMAADINSTTTCLKSPGTSKGCKGGIP